MPFGLLDLLSAPATSIVRTCRSSGDQELLLGHLTPEIQRTGLFLGLESLEDLLALLSFNERAIL